MKVAFRVDGSSAVGGGHVMRCHALATELHRRGADIDFLCREVPAPLAAAIEAEGFRCLRLPPEPSGWEVDAEHCVALLTDERPDWLVVDSYRLAAPWEERLRAACGGIMVIDDLADRAHAGDLLLDATPGRAAATYDGLVEGRTDFLLGAGHALLRRQFARRRLTARLPEVSGRPPRIAVTFGMSDPANGTAVALGILERAADDAVIDVVLGAGAPHAGEISRQAESSRGRIRVHSAVADMAALLAAADLVICSPSTVSLECCALGRPMALLRTAANQEANARALREAGAAVSLGAIEDARPDGIPPALQAVLTDGSRRRELARRAALVCDGLGAARVAATLMPLARARDGGAITLRPATREDGEAMLAWQRAPGARRHARHPEAPSRDGHFRWLETRLADPDCFLNMIQHAGRPMGVLRLDRRGEGRTFEVSILVAAEAHRMGLGRGALAEARRLFSEAELHAEVSPGNEASRNLFLRAGYHSTDGQHYVSPSRPIS